MKLIKPDLYALDGTNSPCRAKKIGLAHVSKGKSGALQRQVVLSYLYSAETGLPITYQTYSGNMADVSSLSIFKDLWEAYGIKDSEAVSIFDRGYFKAEEMTDFNRRGIPYTCAVKMKLKFVQEVLPPLHELMQRKNQIEGTCMFGTVVETHMKPKCEDRSI